MKKVISSCMVCLMALSICAVFSCTKDDNEVDNNEVNNNEVNEDNGMYVDLGLPSGTKWKTTNEKNTADAEYDFFTYDEAIALFGDRLPTKEQWEELIDYCGWLYTGNGCEVNGSNGNSIKLTASGCRDCSGGIDDVGSLGFYWSSTPDDSDDVWILYFFNAGGVYMSNNNRCDGFSVRLVQK